MSMPACHISPCFMYCLGMAAGDKKEMEVVESKADLFAILKATEKLERAYVRDAVAPELYERACEKLILQFKVLWGSLRHAVGGTSDERFNLRAAKKCARDQLHVKKRTSKEVSKEMCKCGEQGRHMWA
eukprot:1161698-Pelagomonas_calceolata.AAC.6